MFLLILLSLVPWIFIVLRKSWERFFIKGRLLKFFLQQLFKVLLSSINGSVIKLLLLIECFVIVFFRNFRISLNNLLLTVFWTLSIYLWFVLLIQITRILVVSIISVRLILSDIGWFNGHVLEWDDIFLLGDFVLLVFVIFQRNNIVIFPHLLCDNGCFRIIAFNLKWCWFIYIGLEFSSVIRDRFICLHLLFSCVVHFRVWLNSFLISDPLHWKIRTLPWHKRTIVHTLLSIEKSFHLVHKHGIWHHIFHIIEYFLHLPSFRSYLSNRRWRYNKRWLADHELVSWSVWW